MKVFIAHAREDKEIAEPIGSWLVKKNIDVFIDSWCLTPGDSLIDRISDAIEGSDKLIVLLSPDSTKSNWVKKEVATGLIMELAEEKGLGEIFVIPVLVKSCKIPIMLRDKLYANFTDKPFEKGCEELYRGITQTPLGLQDETFQNKYIKEHKVSPLGSGQFGLLVEFGAKISPIEGAHIAINVSGKYSDKQEWTERPNIQYIPEFRPIMFYMTEERKAPPVFERRFASPKITSRQSYYCYFEANEPLKVIQSHFKDFYGNEP